MRLFIHQLRLPELEQAGLIDALELRLAAVEGRSDVKAQLVADQDIRLPLSIEMAFYHIAQEALNNSLKHAQAAHVTVTLQRSPAGVVLEVVDDGRGFDPGQAGQGGMGLGNMQARAREIGACLEILSQPGQGAGCVSAWKAYDRRGRGATRQVAKDLFHTRAYWRKASRPGARGSNWCWGACS
jgi:signal transduction histidine kinase